MPVASFDKSRRLLTSAEYSFVFDKAAYRVSHRHYLVLARKGESGHARLGLVVSKKNIRLATRRNRVKRVVRETFRKTLHPLDSLDIIFLARKGFDTLQPSFQTSLMEGAWLKLAKNLESSQ
ncbi:MAG: ribonuclease P protein component [Porticoccaceae bacterium]|jgi:ribonuclease P protein component